MIFLIDILAKAAGAEIRMIREDFINNAEGLVADGYNVKCYLFYMYLVNELLLNIKPMFYLFTPTRYHSYFYKPHFKRIKLAVHFLCAEDL